MENNARQKWRIPTMIFMIIFQVLGSLGLILYIFIAIIGVGYEDEKRNLLLAVIQFASTTISWYAWIPFKRKQYISSVIQASLSVISLIFLLFNSWENRTVYN